MPKNLVLFITDGHRADCLGCYGNPILQTPNIDAFAKDATLFRQSYCTHTVCMPTRASIFTGRYPHIHGVWANGCRLPKDEVTLPQVLAANGYATGACGKIHFEPQQEYDQYAPIIEDLPYYGFQEVHLTENKLGIEYIRFVEQNFPDLVEKVKKRASGLPEEAHELHWITSRAIDFVKDKVKSSQPFFLSCSFHELIPPSNPPETFMDMYRPEDMPPAKVKEGEMENKPWYHKKSYEGYMSCGRQPDEKTLRDILVSYYRQASFLDKQFGQLTDALKDAGVWDDTIVIFTADHGLVLNDHYQWRHGPFLYDEVINVPLIWRVPGMESGTVTDDLVESVDLMPTILDLLDIETPAGVQGQSMRPLVMGEKGAQGRESVLVQDRESPDLEPRGIEPSEVTLVGVRTKDWKLIHYPGCPYGELYDLKNDPDEFDNLWHDAGHANPRKEMERLLLERTLAARDPLPERHFHW
ncbi:MAG: sulfatase-like hydrolase/transferase [Planctomycetes bacterium]|nr:sulfatase-like hydrolase/transferase [Planctomycetota bacterium]